MIGRARVALRIARRDARRSRGRSALVVAMIALPVLGVGARGIYLSRSGRAPRTAGELSLTTALADRLHVTLGDTVRLRLIDPAGTSTSSRTLTVVGLVDAASSRSSRTALVVAASLGKPVAGNLPAPMLVHSSRPMTWADVERANAAGFELYPRGYVPGQPRTVDAAGPAFSTNSLTAASLVGGMALLEIVLLAGPAFAVGAKRQGRELALLSASGAERKDVRVLPPSRSAHVRGEAADVGPRAVRAGSSGTASGTACADAMTTSTGTSSCWRQPRAQAARRANPTPDVGAAPESGRAGTVAFGLPQVFEAVQIGGACTSKASP